MKHKVTDAKIVLGTELFNDRRSFLYECPKCLKQWRYADPETNEYIFCNGNDFGLAEMDDPLTDPRYLDNEYDLLTSEQFKIFDLFETVDYIVGYDWISVLDEYLFINGIGVVYLFNENFNTPEQVENYNAYIKYNSMYYDQFGKPYTYINSIIEINSFRIGEPYTIEDRTVIVETANMKLTELGKLMFNKYLDNK